MKNELCYKGRKRKGENESFKQQGNGYKEKGKNQHKFLKSLKWPLKGFWKEALDLASLSASWLEDLPNGYL